MAPMFAPGTYARFFRRWLEFGRGNPLPIEVSWFIAAKCSIRCGGCLFFAGDGRPSFAAERVLSLEEKLKVVSQLAEINLPFLAVTGGEPFLEPDLMPIIQAACDAGIAAGITTNGLDATPDQILRYDGLCHVVWISIDGFEREHDLIRGPGRYAQSLRTLRGIASRMRKTVVGVSTVINVHNAASIPEFLGFLREMGVAKVGIKVNVIPELRPDYVRHAAALDRLLAFKRRHPSLLAVTEEFIASIPRLCRPENAKVGCRLDLWTHPSILPDGRFSACAAYPVVVGDLTVEHIGDLLRRRDPGTFSAAAACPGCVRGDLPLYDLFLGKPLHRISPRDVLKLLRT
ncbi:MAG: radical SAM protein [Deltaproteobacteria bacterium]|nr:radical SAM protein [Deltaproteobacteria bacterium]